MCVGLQTHIMPIRKMLCEETRKKKRTEASHRNMEIEGLTELLHTNFLLLRDKKK